ncbi:MAG TPA: MerR family transcriptional regulator [Chloroflexi bacterium]|jgi:MerR family transcriptional regulator/heat shock protein HspR|nr:MerR family transcriptional regulator [Chloroflexota bacterium]
MHERRRYTISVAAELVNVHQQTLRHYERLGLVEPFRGKGEIRYYSPQDIEKVQQIRRLIEDLGVNLAGVEVILNMREQMERLHNEFAEEVRRVRLQHEADVHRLKEIILRLQGAQHEQETPV